MVRTSLAPTDWWSNLVRPPIWLAIRLLASGDVEQNPGPQRRRQLTGLVWHALSTRHVRWSDGVRGLFLLPGTYGPTLWRMILVQVLETIHKFLRTIKAQVVNVQFCSHEGASHSFFRYANLGRPHYGWRFGYSPQWTWSRAQDHRGNDSSLVWYGTFSAAIYISLMRSQYQSYVHWSDDMGFPCSCDLCSNPEAGAALLQICTDEQGAAGSRARSGLNWDRTGI